MKKVYLWVGLVVLFVSLNLAIIFKHEKIDRTVLITDPMIAKMDTIKKQFPTKGEVWPSDTYEVYYDERKGELEKVLVEEGDKVAVDAPLIEYRMEHDSSRLDALENSNERIDQQISNLEADIEALSKELMSAEQSERNPANTVVPNPADSTERSSRVIEYSMKDKEDEISLLELQKEQNQTEIETIEKLAETYVENSKVAGVVVHIDQNSRTKDKPLLSIYSEKPMLVKTEIRERDLHKIKKGQEVVVNTTHFKAKKMKGEVKLIKPIPEEKQKSKEKQYAVLIELKDSKQKLPYGVDVASEITLKKQTDVVVLPREAVKENHVIKVEKGRLEKTSVKKGLQVENRTAVQKGVKEGERIVREADLTIKNGSRFITAADLALLDQQTFTTFSTEKRLLLLARGLLE